jgi:hypothetical protein
MLSKQQLLSHRKGSLNESIFKMGDIYRAKVIIDVPRSLINGFVSKAKKENGIDARETWSDMDIAELMIEYLKTTYLNVESMSVINILGEKNITPGDVQTDIQPEENVENPIQPQGENTQPQGENTQPQGQTQPQEIQAQIQPQNQNF